MYVRSVRETLAELRTRLGGDQPFYYSRYGDGDFEIMMGRSEMQHSADPELARELTALFTDRRPEHMLSVALHKNEPGMVDGLFKAWTNPTYYELVEKLTPGSAPAFYNAIALHYATVFNPLEVRELFDGLQMRQVYFVGNAQIDKLQALTGPLSGYVRSVYTNAYQEIDMLYAQLRTQIDKESEQPVILLAAGMASRALIYRLMRDNINAQVIDLGSVVDYVIGNPNRTWIKMAGQNQLAILLQPEAQNE